ncbi:S-layer homology domain-containing protein [Cohnella silvisoli]|uniref:S-layer homology domain-containing protein n=1 Tax=Cohnella silvisoli TaxID=2873699 RepID=A0ABV1L1W4_9BACL|nr:S-layer homology domain-containing protein [Cohnella silvisoli]MCD9025171.1 S-layer homology domain-containing protein [Cohnella silvisoli]
MAVKIASKATGNRFLAFIIVAAMVVGLIAPIGNKAEAAVGDVIVQSVSPTNGSVMKMLDYMSLKLSDPEGHTLLQPTLVIRRISDGKFLLKDSDPDPERSWTSVKPGGLVMNIDGGSSGSYFIYTDAGIQKALYKDDDYEILYEIYDNDGTSTGTRYLTVPFTIDRTPPEINGGYIDGNTLIFDINEAIVKDNLNVLPTDFVMEASGVPVEFDFISPIDNSNSFLALTKSPVAYNDLVKIHFAAGSNAITDLAGNVLSTDVFTLENRTVQPVQPPRAFQSDPVIHLPLKTGYQLKANDAIATFIPSEDSAYVLRFEFPNDGLNKSVLKNAPNLANTDFIIRNNTDSVNMIPISMIINERDVDLVFSSGFQKDKSYTLAMSATASGDEITFPMSATTSATVYVGLFNPAGPGTSITAINEHRYQNMNLQASEVTQAPQSSDIHIVNNDFGTDVLTVDNVMAGGIVKVYDAPSGGNEIGRFAQGVVSGKVTINIVGGSVVPTLYVTVTDVAAGNLESSRVAYVLPAPVQKGALSVTIIVAQSNHDTAVEGERDGQYAAGSKAAFQTAIDAAVGVRNSLIASQAQVDTAVAALNAAESLFNSKKIVIDRSVLSSSIVAAIAKMGGAIEGGADGNFAIGSKDIFAAAIDAAIIVRDDNSATQVQVDTAVSVLNTAVAVFESKVVRVTKTALQAAIVAAQAKHDAATEGSANGQYPTGSKAILQTAITVATTIASNVSATQAQVDAAVAALNATAAAFEAKKIVILPSSGGGVDSGPSTQQPRSVQLTVESGGVVLGKLPLTRTIDANGRAKDQLDLKKEQISEWADRLNAAGKLSLTIPDDNNIVDEYNVTIPAEAVLLLAERNLAFNLMMNGVEITIPASSLKDIKEAIKLKITPVAAKEKQDELERRADGNAQVRSIVGKGALKQIGLPVSIETNLQNRKVTLILPTGSPALSEEQLRNSGIYVEHSDGTQELIVPRKTNNGLGFDVDKFSTFAIVHVERWQEFRNSQAGENKLPYISGYAGGLFKPEVGITRGELAAILAKVIKGEATKSPITFKDVPDILWAKEAIDKVVKLGLMKGSPDGSFIPDKPITRAEMAVIAAAIVRNGASGREASFKDVAGHWAEAEIRTVSTAGILTGFKDGTFRPGKALSRAEAVVLINRLIGRKPDPSEEPRYKDVPATHWAYGDIQAAANPYQP